MQFAESKQGIFPERRIEMYGNEIEMDSLVSVIVPIYKVECYLRKCVDSILNQTYKNLEIILVDDGSPDRCGEICDEYAKIDSRITVIHKQNGGLSDARNAGIDVAHGEYVMFVDSDDYIANNAIELFYQSILIDDVDIVIAGMDSVDENGNSKKMYWDDEKIVCSGIDAFFRIFTGKSAIGAPNRLYKCDLVRDNRFRVGMLHEDVYFTADVFTSEKVKKVAFLPFVGYYYFQRVDGIMGNALNQSPKIDLIQSYEYLLEKSIKFLNDEVKLLTVEEHCIGWVTGFSLVPLYKSSKEYDRNLHGFLKKNWFIVNTLQFSGHYRQRLKLFYNFPTLYRALKGILCR